ncbi:hypothetical protein BAUCODRAFT_444237 [Baudoinia panamericana UAMH 10762]|uniref:Uncharacterized protein n=1 Tax=Baudoinia panamericana (strain UAMH 10762) TaxID=717646 RepID=M2NDB8_BAUPA|nr:uncharacterized protein BAUCODRAFT_444237 [Baudoinia panamericana UAMH 10762]EMC97214.1 hypothetical protein BAUCODRAFT_444237 [Baudoinia panamericana UAMH 10762]
MSECLKRGSWTFMPVRETRLRSQAASHATDNESNCHDPQSHLHRIISSSISRECGLPTMCVEQWGRIRAQCAYRKPPALVIAACVLCPPLPLRPPQWKP